MAEEEEEDEDEGSKVEVTKYSKGEAVDAASV